MRLTAHPTREVSHTSRPRASADPLGTSAISTIAPETTALRAVYYYPPRFARRGSTAVPRQLLRGRRCRTASMQRRARRPRRCAARPLPDADARLRAMSQNLRSQVLRQALRLFPRATVVGHANGHPTRYEDPALLTELAQKPSSAPAPHAERRTAACSFPCPLPPRTAAPASRPRRVSREAASVESSHARPFRFFCHPPSSIRALAAP